MISTLAGVVLTLLQANVATSPPPTGQAGSPHLVTHPDWLKRPSPANMYEVWPAGAYYAHVNGHVVLHCVINEKGRLKQGAATVEEPKGWGYGAAALEMAGQFQMRPETVDGQPVAGAKIDVPFSFLFPQKYPQRPQSGFAAP